MDAKTKVVTLGYVVSLARREIWLAMKKTKLCAGKLNGYGGGVRLGESIKDCMMREFNEECGATTTASNLLHLGCITFYKGNGIAEQKLICECYIFLITDISGLMNESNEMGGPSPFSFDNIPFDEMMPSDILWLQTVLTHRKTVSGYVTFDHATTKVIEANLKFK
jgi:8-oxo-dGTP diphosphatase